MPAFPLPVQVYSTPLTTTFRRQDSRDGLLICGPAGWAEVSPFWDYDIPESTNWLKAGLESACLEHPTPLRDEVPVNVTVPATSPDRAQHIVLTGGCTTAKIKVGEPGQELRDDLDRVAAVRDVFSGKIRLDVNGAWDVETAIDAIDKLDQVAGELEYVEQPCMDVLDLATVRARVNVRIAADESIRRAEDPYLVKKHDAADVMIVKVQPLGGIRTCLRLREELGIPVVVSSALESSVGISAGVALAAAVDELEHACGLATVQLFDHDVSSTPLLPTAGTLPVGRINPDNVHDVDPDIAARWMDRLDAMWAHLQATCDIHELTGGAL